MGLLDIIAAAILMLSGFIQAASGFGSGLTSMGLLPFVMDVRDATVIVALILPFISAQILWKLRKQASLRRAAPYLVGVFAGTPLGVLILDSAGAWVLKLLIGVTLAGFCGFMLVSRRDYRVKSHWALSVGAGFLSGVIAGATNCGGPPLVLYIYMQGLTKEETSATLQVLFFIGTIYKVALFVGRGMVETSHLSAAAVFLVFSAAGIVLGLMLFRRIDTERLRRWVYAMLLVVGVLLIATTVRGLLTA